MPKAPPVLQSAPTPLGVVALQSGSAQSINPSQSLSTGWPPVLSLHTSLFPLAQMHVPAALQVCPKGPQEPPKPLPTGWQSGSAQSISPSQSLSPPSPQRPTSLLNPEPQVQMPLAALQMLPKELQARPLQSGSAQST